MNKKYIIVSLAVIVLSICVLDWYLGTPKEITLRIDAELIEVVGSHKHFINVTIINTSLVNIHNVYIEYQPYEKSSGHAETYKIKVHFGDILIRANKTMCLENSWNTFYKSRPLTLRMDEGHINIGKRIFNTHNYVVIRKRNE